MLQQTAILFDVRRVSIYLGESLERIQNICFFFLGGGRGRRIEVKLIRQFYASKCVEAKMH